MAEAARLNGTLNPDEKIAALIRFAEDHCCAIITPVVLSDVLGQRGSRESPPDGINATRKRPGVRPHRTLARAT